MDTFGALRVTLGGLFVGFATLALPTPAAQPIPYLFQPESSAPPDKIIWATTPGVRYDLFTSGDLDQWTHVPGFPAAAPDLAMEHAFTPAARGFFKIVPIDEQPPVVVTQCPGVDGFAISRFGNITIQLADATGIDPATIRLTVGALGTFGTGSPQVSFAGNMLTFDTGGDTALGSWGQTITATLVVADTLGNTLTHTWSFQLELESQLAANLFVFGSPDALRAGQDVGAIPTRILIPEPIPVAGGDPWTLESVAVDRIVLAYTGAAAPVFAAGTCVCNRTPAKVDEIFYRKISSVSDNPDTKKLTLFTQDIGLQEIITNGAFSSSDDALLFEVGGDGTILRVIERSAGAPLGNLGYSLDDTTFDLTRQDGLDLLSLHFEQLHWWLNNCRFRTSIDLGLVDGLRRMEGVVEGDLDSAMIFHAEVALLGQSLEDEIFDLPAASEPKWLVPLGPLGFALVTMDLKLRAEADAAALLQFRAGYRQQGKIDGLGFRYDKPDFRWINDVSFAPTEVEPFSAPVTGSLSLKFKLVPSVKFLVCGLAGAELALEPNGGVVFERNAQNILTGRLEAGTDLRLLPGGTAVEWIHPQPLLARTLWSGQWPLFANQPPLPAITSQPQDVIASAGGSARFSCAVNSPGGVTWQWQRNGTVMPGQTGATLVLTGLTAQHAGSYSVRATVGGAVLQSSTASLTVLNNLADLADYFQYPLGDRQWKAEFPDYPATPERNTLYPDNPVLDSETRSPTTRSATGWHNAQDTGTYDPAMAGLHPGEDWNKAGGDLGQAVYPIAKGTVVKVSPANSAAIQSHGWIVVVEHKLAEAVRKPGDSESYYSIYTHLSPRADGSLVQDLADEAAFPCQVGASVSMTKPIGYIGDVTALADHLHLELHRKLPGKEINDATNLHAPPRQSNGYYPVSAGAAAAFATMQTEGIIDPSDFIDDHGGAVVGNPLVDGMVLVPAGSFLMGDQSNPLLGWSDELPVHRVYGSGFHIAKHEVTKALWDEVASWAADNGYDINAAGASGKGSNHPAHFVTWYECVKWCNARSQKEGFTPCYTVNGATMKTGTIAPVCNWSANGYRLPTEAEWEKAARGGVVGKNFPWGNTITHRQANYFSSSAYSYDVSPTRGYHPTYYTGDAPYSSPVGSFAPNGYGLYDIAGNMWEWCWDGYDNDYYTTSPGTDPRGPSSNTFRVVRGGSWSPSGDAYGCRVAGRGYPDPGASYSTLGFRLARSSVP